MDPSPSDPPAAADAFAQWQASFEKLRGAERRLVRAMRSTADSHEIDQLGQEVTELRSSSARLLARAEFGASIKPSRLSSRLK